MLSWKRICCAVDFSDASRLALIRAAEIAKLAGAELTILHVHEPPAVSDDIFVTAAEISETTEAQEEDVLAAWRADAERIAGQPVASASVSGAPAEEIARYVKERALDLLVLATHGRTGLRRALIGSVAEQVIRHAPCPVLVVRAG